MKRNIIIFIEVLVLFLVIGFGAMFAYITVTGRSSIGSNKKKRDTNEKVVALVEELNEEMLWRCLFCHRPLTGCVSQCGSLSGW